MDENHVSKEVQVLIERMEQQPHEFIRGVWADEMNELMSETGSFYMMLTAEERRVMHKAYREVLRKDFQDKVVRRVIDNEDDKQLKLFSKTVDMTKLYEDYEHKEAKKACK